MKHRKIIAYEGSESTIKIDLPLYLKNLNTINIVLRPEIYENPSKEACRTDI
jgi:hypothetical protein